MAVYIKNGTPVGSESKCDTCKWSLVVRGFRESEDLTYCDWLSQPMRVLFQVRECSRHEHKSRPTWDQMEELALEIRPSPTWKSAGFCKGEPSTSDVAVAKITVTR
jgi:hypothetical protein